MSNLTLEECSVLLKKLCFDETNQSLENVEHYKLFMKQIYDYSEFAEIKTYIFCDYPGKDKLSVVKKKDFDKDKLDKLMGKKIEVKVEDEDEEKININNYISMMKIRSSCGSSRIKTETLIRDASAINAFLERLLPDEKIILEIKKEKPDRDSKNNAYLSYITNYSRIISLIVNYDKKEVKLDRYNEYNFWLPKQYIEILQQTDEEYLHEVLQLMKNNVEELIRYKYYESIIKFIEEKNNFGKYCDEMLKKVKPIEEMELEQKKIKQEKELIKIAHKHLKQEKKEIMKYREQLENERTEFEEYKVKNLT